MTDVTLNDGKTKLAAIVIDSGHKESLRFIPEYLNKIKNEKGYARYELNDHIIDKDKYGYDQEFIYYTFYTENELLQKYEAAETVWFDVTRPFSDYD